ncbi:hypothetical protein DMUE_4015 [Dictyocoela muelleri]|nr:hypothetical protein DMUE_4015 [Dictyocoela muelleri]
MLDVSSNRSFQQFYGGCINKYMVDKIEDGTNRTKAGNIKKPSYRMVSDICFNFLKKNDSELKKKSFMTFGISREDLEIDKLHLLLKNLSQGDIINSDDLFL